MTKRSVMFDHLKHRIFLLVLLLTILGWLVNTSGESRTFDEKNFVWKDNIE